MATHTVNVIASLDPASKSTGGNESADAGKLLEFNSDGQIQGSSNSSSLAAVKGTASGSGYGVHGESSSGTGVVGQSTTGNGVDAISNAKQAVSAINFHATEPVVKAKNANASNTAPLAQFHRNNNQGLTIKNDGGLEWDSATGAATTRTGLGLGTAATQPSTAFDAAGSASAAETAAIAHADGLVAALGTAASVDTGTGSANVPTTAQADVRYQGKNTVVDTVVFLPPGATIWTNIPAALTFFAGQSRWVIPMDLSAKTDIRLRVMMGGSGGSTNAKIRVLYKTQASGYSTTITDYVTVGTSEVQVTYGTSTNSLITTSWIPIIAGAKADVFIALAGIDGDGAADPAFLNIYLETR